jgi:diadenosine tetraphosphate (Ap4A) HIT family hydrolase
VHKGAIDLMFIIIFNIILYTYVQEQQNERFGSAPHMHIHLINRTGADSMD